ncbi:Sexual differentiation process putative subtilase-type proteinase isp6 [Colletotrichum sp. SAR11_239]|nr:Sexual differentiation process putative subtilase-type proteinase isp6 [Colletotrichum sp. SAR11_239]
MQKMLPDGVKIEVASVYRPCESDYSDPTLQDSKISWRYQNQYLDEQLDLEDHQVQMSYISVNEGSQDEPYNGRYYFDVSAGEDVPVYIVDTGATMDHIEFNLRDKIASKTEFIFIGEDFDGIAKKAKPIMVRVPRREKQGGGATPEDWIDAMSAVAGVFADKTTTTRAILCMAQGHKFDDFKSDWEKTNKKEGQDNEKLISEAWIIFRKSMHGILTGLIEKGFFIVTGAGNGAAINTLPATFSSELTKDFDLSIPELLVVGAAHPDKGNRWWMSGQPPNTADAIPHIYAPGANLLVANGNRDEWPATSQSEGANAEKRQNGNKKKPLQVLPGNLRCKPKVNGCVDGMCVCVLPDLPAPTSFVCTERTVDKCSPGVVCSAPQTNGCVDGKCVCVLPELPSKTTAVQTTLSTVTSKPPDPVPTSPEKPKTPVVIGERTGNKGRGGYIDVGCLRYDFTPK